MRIQWDIVCYFSGKKNKDVDDQMRGNVESLEENVLVITCKEDIVALQMAYFFSKINNKHQCYSVHHNIHYNIVSTL